MDYSLRTNYKYKSSKGEYVNSKFWQGGLLKSRFLTLFFMCILFFVFFHGFPLNSWCNGIVSSFESRIPEHDLSLEWRTKESDNFRAIFPVHLMAFADFILNEAEDIFVLLSTWTKFRPERKIDILITDSSDFANGFVSRSSRGLFITLYAVYPYRSSSSGLDAYQSWYRNILIHEMSHIFHLDIVRGVPAMLNKIFGNVFYPNTCTPPFYIEGFATYSETVNESGFGRWISPYTDMYIRTAYSEDNFSPLDRASNSTPLWPAGQTRYLFGVSFVGYLSEQFGEESLLEFNWRGGAYPIYTWGIPFKKVYGKRLGKIWDEWQKSQEKNNEVIIEKIAKQEVTSLERVGSLKGYIYSVCIDRSGKRIAYSGHPVDSLGGLYTYDIEMKKEKCMGKGLYALDLSFSEDGEKLYFIGYDVYRNVNIKNNLYVLDISTGKVTRITHSGNIQGFELLEYENRLLLCAAATFGTELFIIRLNNNMRKELKFSGKNLSEIKENSIFLDSFILEEPALSPDGKRIAFSFKDKEGHRGICSISLNNLQSGSWKFETITNHQYNAYSPCWINENELLFVGDRNGIYNLYSHNLHSGKTARISNVISGVFEPDISIDGTFVIKEYTSEGFRVSTGNITDIGMPYWQESCQSNVLYTLQNAIDYHSFPKDLENTEQKENFSDFSESSKITALAGDTGGSKPYRSGRWLLPGYWIPFMAGDGVFFGVGFYTSGQDLLKKHVYRTALVYDVVDETFKGLVDYSFNTALFSYFGRLFLSQPAIEKSFEPEVVSYPGISYIFRKRDLFLQTELGIILENPLWGLNSSLLLSNTKKSNGWIGPERGFQLQHGMYYNIEQMNTFAVIDDYFSLYFKPFGVSLLNFCIQSKGGIGRKVLSGSYFEYVYVPLNAVYTLGYPDRIPGNFILDIKLTFGFPLLRVERGPGTFPIFFKGVSLYFFNDNGLIVSDVDTSGFIITDVSNLASPFQHIRSSLGGELNWDFILGYEFPLSIELGYVYTLSEGGSDGFFVTVRTGR
jgi:hypothetical protein